MSGGGIVYGGLRIWSDMVGWSRVGAGVELGGMNVGEICGWEFGLGGESGVWRAVRMRSGYVGKTWCCMELGGDKWG